MQNTPIKQKFTFLKNIKISCARWGVESLFQVIIYEGEDNWPRLTEFHGQGITPLAAFRNARFNRNLGKDPTLRKVVNRLKGDSYKGDTEMARENKLQKEVIEDFLRWAVIRLETDKVNPIGKKTKDKAEERLWALKLICEKADIGNVLENIKDGRIL